MKASEAITILQALDPNHEVILTIGRQAKTVTYTPNGYLPGQTVPYWVDSGNKWPAKPYENTITCGSSAIH